MSEFWETISGFFEDLYMAVVGNSYVPDLVEEVIAWFKKLTSPVTDVLDGIMETAGKLFNKVLGFFSGSTDLELDFSQMLENFTVTLPEAVDAFYLKVTEMFESMLVLADDYAVFLTDALGDKALSAVSKGHSDAEKVGLPVWRNLTKGLKSYINFVKKLAATHIPKIAAAFTDVNEDVGKVVANMVKAIGGIKEKLVEDTPKITAKLNEIITAITNVAKAITGNGGPISALAALQSDMDALKFNAVQNIERDTAKVKDAFDAVKRAVESISKALDDAKRKIDEFNEKAAGVKAPDLSGSGGDDDDDPKASGFTSQSAGIAALTRAATAQRDFRTTRPASIPSVSRTTNSTASSVTNNIKMEIAVDSPQRMEQLQRMTQRIVRSKLS